MGDRLVKIYHHHPEGQAVFAAWESELKAPLGRAVLLRADPTWLAKPYGYDPSILPGTASLNEG